MTLQCADLTTRIESGDSERVNQAIEEIEAMDIGERAEAFDECFDAVAEVYMTSTDGYVRQSCVRVVDALAPGLGAAVNFEDEQTESAIGSEIHEYTDTLCGFFLEAMTDEDGRVRQSAQRGLKSVFRTYDALDDRATVEAVIDELEEMATDYAGKRREHLLDAAEDAEFALTSGVGRVLRQFQDELE